MPDAEPVESPPNTRLPWTKGIAPRYIALFLLVPFADQLAGHSLALGGLGVALVGVTVGAGLAMVLLYYPSTILGLRARRPLDDVAASAFGEVGAAWIVPAVVAVAQLVWFAVTIDYAVEIAFRSLSAFGLLDPRHLTAPGPDGRFSADGLFLWVSACWVLASVVIGTVAFRLVAAVMAGYQAFPALALGAAALWAIPSAGRYVPAGPDPGTEFEPWAAGFLGAMQFVFAFAATFAVLGADWGAASRDEDDVRLGGIVGLMVAPMVIAALALLIVAGANAPAASSVPTGLGPPAGFARQTDPIGETPRPPDRDDDLTLRGSLRSSLPPRAAGLALIVLDLGLLGPACFAPFVLTREARKLAPRLPRWAFVIGGALLAWPLVAVRIGMRIGPVLVFLGALMAPLGGVIAAECVRLRGRWTGPRPGVRALAVGSWLVGLGVGDLPIVGGWLGVRSLADLPLPTLLACFTAFALQWFGGLLGADSKKSSQLLLDEPKNAVEAGERLPSDGPAPSISHSGGTEDSGGADDREPSPVPEPPAAQLG